MLGFRYFPFFWFLWSVGTRLIWNFCHVTNIHNLKRFSGKTLLPLFFVDVRKASNSIDIFEVKFLLNSAIVVENLHPSKSPPQCYASLTDIPKNTVSMIHNVWNVRKITPRILVPRHSTLQLDVLYAMTATNFKGCPIIKNLNVLYFQLGKILPHLLFLKTILPELLLLLCYLSTVLCSYHFLRLKLLSTLFKYWNFINLIYLRIIEYHKTNPFPYSYFTIK